MHTDVAVYNDSETRGLLCRLLAGIHVSTGPSTRVFSVHVSCKFHHVYNFLSSHGPPVRTSFLDMRRKLVIVSLVARFVVKTDDGCVKVEIGLDCHRIANILGKAEFLGEVHEGAR